MSMNTSTPCAASPSNGAACNSSNDVAFRTGSNGNVHGTKHTAHDAGFPDYQPLSLSGGELFQLIFISYL